MMFAKHRSGLRFSLKGCFLRKKRHVLEMTFYSQSSFLDAGQASPNPPLLSAFGPLSFSFLLDTQLVCSAFWAHDLLLVEHTLCRESRGDVGKAFHLDHKDPIQALVLESPESKTSCFSSNPHVSGCRNEMK